MVNTIHDNFCELLDESGFQVYLKNTKDLSLVKGLRIQCLVKAYTQRRPLIELVDAAQYAKNQTKLSKDLVAKIISEIATDWETDPFAELLMMEEVEDSSFESECRNWINSFKDDSQTLETIKHDCTAFMEDSDFFSSCTPTERDYFQQRLTLLIELLGYYSRANQLKNDGLAKEFVCGILDKLEKTGYVYHPRKNFYVMSCLILNDSSLIDESISRLFDIIRKWPLEIWAKEPFKSTLIKVLNLYVEEKIWHIDKQEGNDVLVKNLTQAISILLLLADNVDNRDKTLPDERLNLARLCVLSTYKEKYKNKEVLALALNCLAGSQYYRPVYQLADTEGWGITNKLKLYSPGPNGSACPMDTTNTFIKDDKRLVLSPEGISLYSGVARERTVIPAGMELWQHLQVYADRRNVAALEGRIEIKDCKRLWEDIERELFVQSAQQKRPIATIQEKHHEGDEVIINITRIDPSDKRKAYCRIKGEQEESGYILVDDIVSYMRTLEVWMFQDDATHQPLNLKAVIKTEIGEGEYHFSMFDGIKDFVCSTLELGSTIICSVGMARRAGAENSVPAITDYGESVSLRGDFYEPLAVGDLVEATYEGTATGTFHITCSIANRYEGEKINLVKVFSRLIGDYAASTQDTTTDAPAEEEQTPEQKIDECYQNDRMLDAAYVKEVVRIIDRMAFTDTDYVRSYNYLAFARVLCRLVGWNGQAEYYRSRLQLISLLSDFAINDRVDAESLAALENTSQNLFNFDSSMANKYKQLLILSYMGKRECNDELWRFSSVQDASTDDVRKIASLALAYNILSESRMKQADDVLNRIKETLNLSGYESNLDIYGQGIETRTVEYKTSIVFPPDNHMKPNLRLQMNNILAVIASFLNTDGGTLYIGCNNSGAGVGLENDLDYYEFNGDKDKYMLCLSNEVSARFGVYAKTFVKLHWETGERSGREILVVEVEPFEDGVCMDGVWFYRDDNSKKRLNKEEFEKYNERRKQRKAQAQAHEAENTTAGTAQPAPRTTTQEERPAAQRERTKTESIKTSTLRTNALYDNGEDYRPYVACLRLLVNGKLSKTSDSAYYDDEQTDLALAVYDEETQNGYLVLGYEDGSVTKVPVRELLRCEDYREYNRNNSSPLVFATIAFDGDGLVSLTREAGKKGRVCVRVDRLDSIEEGRWSDKGQELYNEGLSQETLRFEIIPADELGNVSQLTGLGKKTLGKPLATSPAKIKKALERCGITGVE